MLGVSKRKQTLAFTSDVSEYRRRIYLQAAYESAISFESQ